MTRPSASQSPPGSPRCEICTQRPQWEIWHRGEVAKLLTCGEHLAAMARQMCPVSRRSVFLRRLA